MTECEVSAAESIAFGAAGYGAGHRVATLLENRPEYVLHKLALNTLGVCCVPINPDHRAGEIAYLLDHAKPDLVLNLAGRTHQITLALDQAGRFKPFMYEPMTHEEMVEAVMGSALGPATT